MKKILIFIMLLIFVMLISCTIDNNTGLLTITNLTINDVSNIKIGDTYIVGYLPKGKKVDYWFSIPLVGRLSGGSITQVAIYDKGDRQETRNKPDLSLKYGYEYKIEIIEKDSKNWFYVYRGIKTNTDYDDDDRYDNPFE